MRYVSIAMASSSVGGHHHRGYSRIFGADDGGSPRAQPFIPYRVELKPHVLKILANGRTAQVGIFASDMPPVKTRISTPPITAA